MARAPWPSGRRIHHRHRSRTAPERARRAATASRCCATPTGDGKPELRTVFIDHLNSPFGITLVGDTLYVADTDAILEFRYAPGATRITAPPVKLTDLPAGPLNHHWTKALTASPDGSKLYVGVGSNSNITENGMDAEAGRAAIYEVDRMTGAKRIYASGVRNPTGLAFEPQTRQVLPSPTNATRSGRTWCRTI